MAKYGPGGWDTSERTTTAFGASLGGSGAPAPGLPGIPTTAPTALNPTASAVAQQSASAADPFAAQRGQYQGQLSQLMGGLGGNQVSQDIQAMRQQSQQQPGGRYAGMLEKLMTDPNSIQMTAGSQFQEKEAMNQVGRAGAAQGQLGSGNILTELQDRAQGIASTDYNNQVSQMMKASELTGNQQNQQFGQMSGVAGIGAQREQQQMGSLLTASGANQGNLGAASSALAKQFEWSQQSQPNLQQGSSIGQGSGVFRDQMGNLRLDTPEQQVEADSLMKNWGKSSSLTAPVYGAFNQAEMQGNSAAMQGM